MVGAIGRGLLAVGKGLGRGLKEYARVGYHSVKAEQGGLGKAFGLLTLPMMAGAIPGVGHVARKVLPFGETLAANPLATSGRFQTSRNLANQIKRNPLPRPVGGPTTRGIGTRSVAVDRYGLPKEKVVEAHAMKSKIASPLANISPAQAIALAGAASVGTALGTHLLSGALNKMEDIRREAGRQTNMKKTMRILAAVNPEVQDSPRARAKARAYYNVVHRSSPYVAREPIVAASVINSMISTPTELPPIDQFKQLLDLEASRNKDRKDLRLRAPVSIAPEQVGSLLGIGTDG